MPEPQENAGHDAQPHFVQAHVSGGTVVRLITTLRKKTRGARLEIFKAFVEGIRGHTQNPLKVVDIGGTVVFWENWWRVTEDDRLQITLINNHDVDSTARGQVSRYSFIENVNQDAATLTPDDLRKYDIIFSNSFLEHLTSWRAQKELSQKITTSEVPYFIQVPNKHSPVDPHHPFAPFFALYPKPLRIRLVLLSAFGNPGPGAKRATSLDAARKWQDGYTPLGLRDLQKLFPEGSFTVERPFGVPMSILAYRGTISKN